MEAEHDEAKCTRLEHLTINAIRSKNYKFIQWLLEMAVGRPAQSIELDETALAGGHVTINIPSNKKELK